MLVLMAVASPGSAAAAPRPGLDEWWFTSWGVQPHLWSLSTGKGVTVALIDTGVQADLPDLQGVVLPGMDAGNRSGDGREDVDPSQESPGHGTAMASLIAAQGRGTGLVGVAPDAKILPIVAQGHDAYVTAIRFAADRGAQVINISQGFPGRCSALMQEAIAYAVGKDAVVVASAGNYGDGANTLMTPASCKGVLSVGAVNAHFEPWEKTQRQAYVKVAAPGVEMRVVLRDGKLYRARGSDAAAAVTSAAVAIIRAKHPGMKNREVVRQLTASAMDIYKKGKDDRTGYGIIRPYRPLAGKAPKGTVNPVFDEFDEWMTTQSPGAAEPAAPEKDDDSSLPLFVVWGAILAMSAAVCVFAFFFSRRKRGGPPPPLGPGVGPGAPVGFGPHQVPGPLREAGPHYQPHPPPVPPGQSPPDGAPPVRPPR
ncbi:S8 family serine peptidase [Actinomadura chokoriensis]|uniref:S8 family serine peptidase n=1 Tax=Actinomadura chokoriensis TaxID=454156 RepID=UPI0031F79909